MRIWNAHKDECEHDMAEEFHWWNNGTYFNSGMYEGRLEKIFLDNAPKGAEAKDPEAPAQMIAGWLFGITDQALEYRDKIVGCYKTNVNITNDYYDGMAAYKSGNSTAGDAKFNDARQYYDDAFSGCASDVTDALTKWTDKVDALANIKNWDQVSKQIYTQHKDVLDQDIQFEFMYWDQGVYYNAGMYGGRFDKTFLDYAPKGAEVRDPQAPA